MGEMGQRIDDTLLDKIAIVGEVGEIQQKLQTRYGDIFDICTSGIFTGQGYSEGRYHQGISQAIKSA